MAVLPGTFNIYRFSFEIYISTTVEFYCNDRLISSRRQRCAIERRRRARQGAAHHARKGLRATLDLGFATKIRNEPPEAHHQRQAHGRR
jgi:hypothetical protein